MGRTPSGLTGADLLATVQAQENQELSVHDLAVKCGYVTEKGAVRVTQFKIAVANASGLFFGKTTPGDIPAQRGGTSNKFKAQKNGILVAAKRFLQEIGVLAGQFANVMVAEVEAGTIDVGAFDISEGTKVVLIVKNHDPVSANEDEDGDDDVEVDEDEDAEAEESATKAAPAPVSSTIRIPQPEPVG